jgi:hypothetical protein
MVVIHLCVKLSVCGFHGNGRHFEISKPQNHLYTCHTTFLLSLDFDVGNCYPWFGSHIMIHFVGISTVVCGSFWGVEQIQNGGRTTFLLSFIPIPSTLKFSRFLWPF